MTGVQGLVAALASSARLAPPNDDIHFLFYIDHCFGIKGQGTILTGESRPPLPTRSGAWPRRRPHDPGGAPTHRHPSSQARSCRARCTWASSWSCRSSGCSAGSRGCRPSAARCHGATGATAWGSASRSSTRSSSNEGWPAPQVIQGMRFGAGQRGAVFLLRLGAAHARHSCSQRHCFLLVSPVLPPACAAAAAAGGGEVAPY